MRLLVAMIAVMALSLAAVAQSPTDAPPRSAGGTESLGNQLLEDLGPEIDQPAAAAPRRPANGAPRDDALTPDPQSGAHPRFDDLGEDIGQPSGPLSLERVRQGMQRAETLLADPRAAADAGLVQRQVVAQLDKLIEELSKQCQACQQGSQSPKPNPSQRSQPKPGKPGPMAGRGKAPAPDSTDRLDAANAQPIDKRDIDELVKDLWGHLPERSREQMMQSFSDEFLPKYELEIEEYYRRLSEESEESSAERR